MMNTKKLDNKGKTMLIQFRCEASSSVSMFESDAQQMLKLMNQSGKVPSALRAEDVETAWLALVENLKNETNDAEEDDISISTRAYPLTQLLKHAAKKQEYVMWDYDTNFL